MYQNKFKANERSSFEAIDRLSGCENKKLIIIKVYLKFWSFSLNDKASFKKEPYGVFAMRRKYIARLWMQYRMRTNEYF